MNDNRLIKVQLYSQRKEVTDFDMYIYGTKNADEQKHDSFGKALKRYADDTGINASDLARFTGISKTSLSFYFNGKRQVGFNTLIALCLALRLHPLRTEHLFELTNFELRKSEPRYYIIKEHLSGCAYDERFSLYNCQMRLKEYNFELLVSDKEEENQ